MDRSFWHNPWSPLPVHPLSLRSLYHSQEELVHALRLRLLPSMTIAQVMNLQDYPQREQGFAQLCKETKSNIVSFTIQFTNKIQEKTYQNLPTFEGSFHCSNPSCERRWRSFRLWVASKRRMSRFWYPPLGPQCYRCWSPHGAPNLATAAVCFRRSWTKVVVNFVAGDRPPLPPGCTVHICQSKILFGPMQRSEDGTASSLRYRTSVRLVSMMVVESCQASGHAFPTMLRLRPDLSSWQWSPWILRPLLGASSWLVLSDIAFEIPMLGSLIHRRPRAIGFSANRGSCKPCLPNNCCSLSSPDFLGWDFASAPTDFEDEGHFAAAMGPTVWWHICLCKRRPSNWITCGLFKLSTTQLVKWECREFIFDFRLGCRFSAISENTGELILGKYKFPQMVNSDTMSLLMGNITAHGRTIARCTTTCTKRYVLRIGTASRHCLNFQDNHCLRYLF